MINFKNKKILITGASGGIGNALVKKFVSLEGEVLATGEHLLLHVSLKTRKTCPASKEIIDNLIDLQKKHEKIDVGIKPKMVI